MHGPQRHSLEKKTAKFSVYSAGFQVPTDSEWKHIPDKVEDIHILPTSREQSDSVQIGLIPLNWAVISCLNFSPVHFAKCGSNIL